MARHIHPTPDPTPDSSRTATTPFRVVLAEDHELMRRSLVLLLEDDAGVDVVAEARELRSAVVKVLEARPDVLVLDLGMPDGSSLEAIEDLRARAPRTQIVALTMNADPVFARSALAAGARGFVLKQLADEELVHAVDAVAQGDEYVSPRVSVPPTRSAMQAVGGPRAVSGVGPRGLRCPPSAGRTTTQPARRPHPRRRPRPAGARAARP